MMIRNLIKEAREDLEKGDYLSASVSLDGYARKEGLPAEFGFLLQKAREMGAKEEIRKAREAIVNGKYAHAGTNLNSAKIYAEKAGIPVPKEVNDLRNEIIKRDN